MKKTLKGIWLLAPHSASAVLIETKVGIKVIQSVKLAASSTYKSIFEMASAKSL